MTYVGAVLLMVGLGITTLSSIVRAHRDGPLHGGTVSPQVAREWERFTLEYFELFEHDMARPLRRILDRERELAAMVKASGERPAPGVRELLDEIELQTPSFRLMMSNIQVLMRLEGPQSAPAVDPLDPMQIVRKIVERYTPLCARHQKEISWWSEPPVFGIVHADGAALEHILTNLVDNAARHATKRIELELTRDSTHFFVRVRDDGPGIPPHYAHYIFDRGWTSEVIGGEEKTSSGLGLYIARGLAKRYGGELSISSVEAPGQDHGTVFLLSLPLQDPIA